MEIENKIESRIIYLYKITNLLDGKIYIGQSVNPSKRWRDHIYYSKRNNKYRQYIHHAMNKHGIENFNFEVIAGCRTQEDADYTEDQLMIQYNSKNSEFGYNLTSGASNGGHSEETKQKLREATLKQIAEKGHPAYGTKRTEEVVQKMKNNWKENHPPVSEEVRKKMSDSHKGKKLPEEQVRKIAAANKGRKLSEEHKQILLECNKNRIVSEETRNKMSERRKQIIAERKAKGEKVKKEIIFLYKITNIMDNRVYIGQSMYPSKRWNAIKNRSKKVLAASYLYNDMDKCGNENFTFEVLACTKGQDNANVSQNELIDQYNSLNINFGYNLRKIADM
ncbi:MAG: GIY-YIG nuclease family protein [Chitinophagales bacterium]|nr:GIY-YIG nuclease family protein [Chitinophagales bacterium]